MGYVTIYDGAENSISEVVVDANFFHFGVVFG